MDFQRITHLKVGKVEVSIFIKIRIVHVHFEKCMIWVWKRSKNKGIILVTWLP